MALRVALDKKLASTWSAGAAAWKTAAKAPLPEMIEHQNVANKHFQEVHLALIQGPHPRWYELAKRLDKIIDAQNHAPDHLGRMRDLCTELEALVGRQALDVHCVERATYDAETRSFGPRTKSIRDGFVVLGAGAAAWTVGLIDAHTAGIVTGLALVYAIVHVTRWDSRSRKAQETFTAAMERHVQLAKLGATKQLPKLKPGVPGV